ncbi:MAG: hypothetical protein ACRD15_18245 [Vicinamibacterales bacterium]
MGTLKASSGWRTVAMTVPPDRSVRGRNVLTVIWPEVDYVPEPEFARVAEEAGSGLRPRLYHIYVVRTRR